MSSADIFHIHNEVFKSYDEGDITFQECWTRQSDILERCETLLKQQIESLKGLKVHNNGNTSVEDTLKQSEKEKSNGQAASKQTWNAGVLSTLINTDADESKNKESKPLECPECHTKFSNHMQNLRDHVETMHIKIRLHCNHCTLHFPTRKKLWQHLKSDVTNQRGKDLSKLDLYKNQCGLCDSEKMKKIDLRKHIVERHPIFKDIFAIPDANPISKVAEVKKEKPEEEDDTKEPNDGDLETFISQIESNLDKFSKILDESKSEADVKTPATSRKRKTEEANDRTKTPKARRQLLNNDDDDDFKKFECKFCDQDFSSKPSPSNSLTQHMEKIHYRLQYTCNKCEDFSTADKILMDEHIEESHVTANVNKKQMVDLHRDYTSYICSVCAEVFEEIVEVIDHMEEEHLDQLERKTTKQIKRQDSESEPTEKTPAKLRTKPHGPKGRMIQCPQCSFKSYILWNLKVHLGTHLGAMFCCTVCDEKYRRKFDLTEHIRDKHPDPVMANSGYSSGTKKWLDSMTVCSCDVCGFSGKSVTEYDEHLHTVHNLPFGPDKQV